MEHDDETIADAEDVVDLAGQVRDTTVSGLPDGYDYKATRYADVILKEAFPNRFRDLTNALEQFGPTLDELRSGGGGKTVFVARFDQSLADQQEDGNAVWGKQNITIQKDLGFEGNVAPVSKARGHEIDMFGDLISKVIQSKDGGFKYGTSSTHWDKLVPRVNLGGGGECPLLLIGIRPERIEGIELAYRVREKLDEAENLRTNWREAYESWNEAKPAIDEIRDQAFELMPPVAGS